MAKKNLRKGIFITFEGPEGCGKTTQSRLLYEYLKKRSYNCLYTREPGGTKTGEAIREILLKSDGINISDITELFLFEAARSQIVEEVIKPALDKKRIIICDRFYDATLAYQGYGGGLPLETIKTLNVIASSSIKPDLTILLDLDTATGLKRAKAKGFDRMEEKRVAYHKRVRNGYLKLAKEDLKRMKVIKVTETIDKTQNLVRREAERVI